MSATQAVLAAIVTRYKSTAGDAIRAAGCTGLYFGRAPQEAVYPFIVMNVPASESVPTIGQGSSSGAIYDDIDINVGAFDDKRTPSRGLSIMSAWGAAFNFVTLSLASPYKQIEGHKVTDLIPVEEPDQKGWHCVTTFVYNVAE